MTHPSSGPIHWFQGQVENFRGLQWISALCKQLSKDNALSPPPAREPPSLFQVAASGKKKPKPSNSSSARAAPCGRAAEDEAKREALTLTQKTRRTHRISLQYRLSVQNKKHMEHGLDS